MRHLGSIALSFLLCAAIYVLTGIGSVKWTEAVAFAPVKYLPLGVALAALIATGLLYSVLLLTRLSPMGPALAGLSLFGVFMWATVASESFTSTVPRGVAGVDPAGWAGAGPIAAVLAVPLIATIVSPRRWRRHSSTSAGATPGFETPSPYTSTPAYSGGQGDSSYGSTPGQQDPSHADPFSAPPAYPAYPPPYIPPSYTPRAQGTGSNDPNAFDPEATRRL
jgi:hypothetical protein